MTEYYNEKLQQGLEYQDFIFEQLKKMNDMPLFLGAYSSKKYQYEKGESLSGLEIKFDDKLSVTGNLFIETFEKTDAANKNYVRSGIMRCGNSWLYLIGNYKEAFIFSVSQLRCYCENYQQFTELKQVGSKTKTSIGILFPVSFIKKFNLCLKHLEFSIS